jgi:hypothetical protein
VWVLHERHITEFDGTFSEWETVSAERRHAAAVVAAEDEALRRVQEKKKTTRRDENRRESKDAVRAAKRRVSELELEIQQLESTIAALTRDLEDPALYTRPDGVARARQLGADLDRQKADLERALEAWGDATETADALSAGSA